jgi:ATP-dependent helicase/nuclease subunit A
VSGRRARRPGDQLALFPSADVPLPAAARPVTDEEARRIAREDLDASLALEAGAGTGKTTLLVERILNLVGGKGVRIDEIVAITFTEKAAAELKVRVREGLEKRLAEAGVRADAGAARVSETASRYRTALRDLALANISTIHAFAGALLRERPVEARIDPAFEQLDAVGESRLFDEVWERWEERALLAEAEPYRRALEAGVQRDRVRRLARRLLEYRELIPHALPERPDDALVESGFADVVRESAALAAFAGRRCRARDDKQLELIRAGVRTVAWLEGRSPAERRAALFAEPRIFSHAGWGKPSNWADGSIDEARSRLAALAAAVEGLGLRIGAGIGSDLALWLVEFLDAYRREKERRGVLDFHDLLLCARNLLRDEPAAREDFKVRFSAILVDEFQDTDPLQSEIVFFLSEAGAGAVRWDEVTVAPGRLFIVGDPKQAIYRFRRADIDVYTAVQERVSGGAPLPITRNFRSVPGIVSWANALFADLFAEESDGGETSETLSQAPFEPIEATRDAGELGPAILLVVPPAEAGRAERPNIDEVRALEAAALAEVIADGVARREFRARDVAILFRTFTDVQVYEEALAERGIDHQVEGGKTFFQRGEVRALLSCLTAVDDPENPVAVVAALASPHFGISDDALAAFAAEGRAFRYLDGAGAHPEIAEAFEMLRRLHAARHDGPLHRLVERILDETHVLEFHALDRRDRRAVANLRKVAEKARAFEAAGPATPRAFVRWLREEEDVGDEGDSPVAEPTEEVVRLSTIHRAKGLEFPVVAIANLAADRPFSEDFLVENMPPAVAFTLGPKDHRCRSANFEAQRDREKRRKRAEERRLLYVAVTRARDRLILAGHAALAAKTEGTALFTDLLRGLPPRAAWTDGAEIGGVRVVVAPRGARAPHAGRPAPIAAADIAVPADDATWLAARADTRARGRVALPVLTSRRMVDRRQFARRDELEESAGGGRADGADSGARTSLGRFVHAVLDALPGLDPARLDETAASIAVRDAFAGDRDEALALAHAILADPVMERARRAPRLLREVPFSVVLGGRLAEGVVDLAFEDAGGALVIVDYKTGRVEAGEGDASRGGRPRSRPADGAARLRDHAAARGEIDQMALYTQALHAATGRPIREAVLLYAREPGALAIPAPELLSRVLPDPFPSPDDGDEFESSPGSQTSTKSN